MQEFQRKKDQNLLLFNTITEKECLNTGNDLTKNLYDYTLKHEGQIKRMETEIASLKSQLIDLSVKCSLNTQKNNYEDNLNINNNSYLEQILIYKEDIKNDLMKDINNIIISQQNEFKEKFENFKEKFELLSDEKYNSNLNNRIMDISGVPRYMMKGNEKNNYETILLNKTNNNTIDINNTTENIIKRIDIIDLDFDRLVQSLKTQFLTNANTINKIEASKVDKKDYETQINLINQKIKEIMLQINNNNNNFNNSDLVNTTYTKYNLNKINNNIDNVMKNELILFKNEVYNDLEKINLKILNELKNQADDIKILYKKMNISTQTIEDQNIILNQKINQNSISYLESELSKKANLDQLNFALEAQSKLNEAFSSASRICRLCWDSEGNLKDDKYIIWSVQSINTALNVFKWENNSESITIMENGVYKIIIGLIGLEKNKNFGIIYNDDKNVIINNNNINKIEELGYIDNDDENNNNVSFNNKEKGNVVFMESYIACIENTKIKAIIFNNNTNNTNKNSCDYDENCENNNNNYSIDDNSEEAFLEIIKII